MLASWISLQNWKKTQTTRGRSAKFGKRKKARFCRRTLCSGCVSVSLIKLRGQARPLRLKPLPIYHQSASSSRPGRERTYTFDYFCWPRLAKSVKQFVKSCDICQRSKVWPDRAEIIDYEHKWGATLSESLHIKSERATASWWTAISCGLTASPATEHRT